MELLLIVSSDMRRRPLSQSCTKSKSSDIPHSLGSLSVFFTGGRLWKLVVQHAFIYANHLMP